MDVIETTLQINQKINVDVPIYNVIETINQMPMTARWNIVSKFLNKMETTPDELMGNQKEEIKDFLIRKLELFKDVSVV